MQTISVIHSDYDPKYYYNEDNQNFPCKFAHVMDHGDRVEVLHKPVLCRDYLLDTLIWKHKVVPCKKVHGYKFNEDHTPYMLYVSPLPHCEKNLEFFHQAEDIAGVNRSVVRKADNEEDSYIFQGDPWWFENTVRYSLWTWMIRNFLFPPEPKKKEISFWGFYWDRDYKKLISLPHLEIWNYKNIKKEDTIPEEYHSYNGFLTIIKYPDYSIYGDLYKSIL